MKVSVILVTYNHEPYIRQAIDNVLLQQTNFDFELLISEDCSTDGTRAIIAEYQQRFPQRIRVLLSSTNLCTNEVLTRALEAARGEYIATLDGDDYWTKPHKLERQVSFLTDHPECSMCFHDVMSVSEPDLRLLGRYHSASIAPITGLKDIVRNNYIASCSAMLRKSAIAELPSWYDQSVFGDWPLYITAAEHGHIGFLPDVMAVYRIHGGGLWSRKTRLDQIGEHVGFYKVLLSSFGDRPEIVAQIQERRDDLCNEMRTLVFDDRSAKSLRQRLRELVKLVRTFPDEITSSLRSWLFPESYARDHQRYSRLLNWVDRVRSPWSRMNADHEGYLDTVDEKVISGWCWDRNAPRKRVQVTIHEGSVQLAIEIADRFRADLLAAGKGDGFHAFVYVAQEGRAFREPVRVTIQGSDWNLPFARLENRPIKRIALLQFHDDFDVCANRVKLLQAFNPGMPILGLYGGDAEHLHQARNIFRDPDAMYHFSGRDSRWKWQNTDLLVRAWYRDVGRHVDFDVVHVMQWDLVILDSLASAYAGIPNDSLALTGVTRIDAIADRWHWTTVEPHKTELARLAEFVRKKFDFGPPTHACLGPGYALPRAFLDQFSTVEVPELGHDEIRLPLYAQILGFEICDTGFYQRWFDPCEERYFNANGDEIDSAVIRAELENAAGRRAFHPVRYLTNIPQGDRNNG